MSNVAKLHVWKNFFTLSVGSFGEERYHPPIIRSGLKAILMQLYL